MKKWFLPLLAVLIISKVNAQELEVTVEILTPKLQTVDPKVFQTLKQTMEEFMNNQKWTEDEFEQEERIRLDMIMTITTEIDANTFEAEIQLQSTRPVFGSHN